MVAERDKPIKGYYKSEAGLVATIKANVTSVAPARFKTIECSIMDVADDIAYSTYDIDDAFVILIDRADWLAFILHLLAGKGLGDDRF